MLIKVNVHPTHLYSMSKRLELSSRKGVGLLDFIDKRHLHVISLGIGYILGLSVFLTVSAVYTSGDAGAEVKSVVEDCKASVIKFVPMGAYSGGSQQVISALNYCKTLG
jgi:hypothetical protein